MQLASPLVSMPEAPGLYAFFEGRWAPDDAATYRNLGCPFYDDCLAAAVEELSKTEVSGRKPSGRRTWKLKREARTWICDERCPHRRRRETFHMELLKTSCREPA